MKNLKEIADSLAKENGFDGARFIANVGGRPVFACYFEPVDGRTLSTGIPVMLLSQGGGVYVCPAEKNLSVFQEAIEARNKKLSEKLDR